jgi:hypothetical protein
VDVTIFHTAALIHPSVAAAHVAEVHPKLEIQPLVALLLGSVAFSIALFTFFGANQRLRESSTLLLQIVGLFAFAALVFSVILIGEQERLQTLADVAAYVSAVSLALGWIGLLFVFWRAYGHVNYLRERRVIKHMRPFRDVRNLFSRRLLHQPNISRIKLTVVGCQDLFLDRGYSILIVGPRVQNKRWTAFDLLNEGVANKESAEYVCCDRHPTLLWRELKEYLGLDGDGEELWRANFQMTDAFSRNLSFDDQIAVDSFRLLCHDDGDGLKVRQARTIAGVHTVGSQGWWKRAGLWERMRKKAKDPRLRPNRIVYDCLSTLTESAGPERVRDFYLHALSCENLNSMVTIIIEHDDADGVILRAVEGTADIVIRVEDGVPVAVRAPLESTQSEARDAPRCSRDLRE